VISVAASLVQAHPRTLRIYEDEGLLAPARTPTNIRLYSENDIRRILWIRRLTQERGVNLAGVRLLFELEERLGTRLLEALFDEAVARQAAVAMQSEAAEATEATEADEAPETSDNHNDNGRSLEADPVSSGNANGSLHGRLAGQSDGSGPPTERPITRIVATRVTTPRGDFR
jgi:MerR family transcriptional regulator/heat shock protein HspR